MTTHQAAHVAALQWVADDIEKWFGDGIRPDEWKLREWADRLTAALAALTASPQAAPDGGESWASDDFYSGHPLPTLHDDPAINAEILIQALTARLDIARKALAAAAAMQVVEPKLQRIKLNAAWAMSETDPRRLLPRSIAYNAASPQVQGGDAVLWVNPDDLANPLFVGVNAVKEGHEHQGKHYTMPLYATPQRAPGVDASVVETMISAGTLLQQSASIIDRREGEALLKHARALASGPSGVDGWVHVPREPTQAMRDAGQAAHHEAEEAIHAGGKENWARFGLRANRAAHVYEAMIAAAAQDQGEGHGGECIGWWRAGEFLFANPGDNVSEIMDHGWQPVALIPPSTAFSLPAAQDQGEGK